jgi:DNA gyrase inhibitor GyrI
MTLGLCLPPQIVTRPPVAFFYFEAHGPFLETAPGAWQEFWTRAGSVLDGSAILSMMSLSRTDMTKQGDARWVYLAGVALRSAPQALPAGIRSGRWEGGKYACYVLRGSYGQLPSAFPAAYDDLAARGLATREDFVVENYLNTPADTAEADLLTEILIPIR